MKKDIHVIIGPTAVGKSSLAMQEALETGAEIISADAFQVYRGMDIGTAKPSKEEQRLVPHHLIDIHDPDEPFSVSIFLNRCREAIQAIRDRGKPVILCGGTAFYVNAFLHEATFDKLPAAHETVRTELNARLEAEGAESLYDELVLKDPVSAERIGPHNHRRLVRALEILTVSDKLPSDMDVMTPTPREDVRVTLLTLPREALVARIHKRVDIMVEHGLFDEVKSLLGQHGTEQQAFQAIGYREVVQHYQGTLAYDETVERIKAHTRQFSRRQMTWYRKLLTPELLQ